MIDIEMNLLDFRDFFIRDVVVYGDFNCFFCFVLYECFFVWNLFDCVEWCLIVYVFDLEVFIFFLED